MYCSYQTIYLSYSADSWFVRRSVTFRTTKMHILGLYYDSSVASRQKPIFYFLTELSIYFLHICTARLAAYRRVYPFIWNIFVYELLLRSLANARYVKYFGFWVPLVVSKSRLLSYNTYPSLWYCMIIPHQENTIEESTSWVIFVYLNKKLHNFWLVLETKRQLFSYNKVGRMYTQWE